MPELQRRLLRLADLVAAEEVRLPAAATDLTLPVELGGDMMTYRWTINDRTFDQAEPLRVREGQRARLGFTNTTTMYHPMHLHGHTFQVRRPDGRGPRKDTVVVLPRQRLDVDIVADNPGRWLVHCHNIYHAETGMMTTLAYQL